MKHFLLLAGLFVFLISCQKIKEQIGQDMIVRAITDGVWRITSYTQGGVDRTADFAAYRFQFRTNYTVDAIHNGATETTGTWQPDVPTKVVTISFPNVPPLLPLLNGAWQITRNSWTFVEAAQTVNGEVVTLRIDK
jgi:hypothetical protein